MKVVFKSNSHQSHYLFLFKISFVIGKQKTLANENVLIIPERFLKNSRKKLTITNGGLELFASATKNPDFSHHAYHLDQQNQG